MRRRRILHWPSLMIFGAISVIGGFAGLELLGMEFWSGFVLTAVGMAITGWIATVEDERAGGFNNPTRDRNGGGETR